MGTDNQLTKIVMEETVKEWGKSPGNRVTDYHGKEKNSWKAQIWELELEEIKRVSRTNEAAKERKQRKGITNEVWDIRKCNVNLIEETLKNDRRKKTTKKDWALVETSC